MNFRRIIIAAVLLLGIGAFGQSEYFGPVAPLGPSEKALGSRYKSLLKADAERMTRVLFEPDHNAAKAILVQIGVNHKFSYGHIRLLPPLFGLKRYRKLIRRILIAEIYPTGFSTWLEKHRREFLSRMVVWLDPEFDAETHKYTIDLLRRTAGISNMRPALLENKHLLERTQNFMASEDPETVHLAASLFYALQPSPAVVRYIQDSRSSARGRSRLLEKIGERGGADTNVGLLLGYALSSDAAELRATARKCLLQGPPTLLYTVEGLTAGLVAESAEVRHDVVGTLSELASRHPKVRDLMMRSSKIASRVQDALKTSEGDLRREMLELINILDAGWKDPRSCREHFESDSASA